MRVCSIVKNLAIQAETDGYGGYWRMAYELIAGVKKLRIAWNMQNYISNLLFIPLETTKMFYVYVLQSKRDGKWYTGYTNDLRKRFKEHNLNKMYSTKGRGPFLLIYYGACLNQQDTTAREKYLKTGMGKRFLKNRLKHFLSLTG
jgi:putative endonuclease